MPKVDSSFVEESFRSDGGRAIATLSRALRDVHRAEDAVQEAYITALDHWPREGAPANPLAWIITTARNKIIDGLRREAVGAQKMERLARLELVAARIPQYDSADADSHIPDDRLGLLFACAHPSLQIESRVALTLRAVAGLTTEEIAGAFLVSVPTMAQRLVRAKNKIRRAGISLEIPDAAHLPERLDAVCATLYVLFTEGYSASSGTHRMRIDLCQEAIRLARLLDQLLPEQPEILGLLALMLLQHSRRDARIDPAGDVLTLEEQDRSRWDRAMIDEGMKLLANAARQQREGPYQLQAAIAAVHALAPRATATNWKSIVALYDRLLEWTDSPIVALNRAVALAMSQGLEFGLAAVDALAGDARLANYYLFSATRADLLRRLGRSADAAIAYERAIAQVANVPERRFFERRLSAISPNRQRTTVAEDHSP